MLLREREREYYFSCDRIAVSYEIGSRERGILVYQLNELGVEGEGEYNDDRKIKSQNIMSQEFKSREQEGRREVFIGKDSFNNELSLTSQRPLGEVVEVGKRREKAGFGDSPSDYFNEIDKEVRFQDGREELACRFTVEFTDSVVSEPQVTVTYLSPEVQISELGAQSGKKILHEPGHFGAYDLSEKKEID